jgi:hypothetical protein
MRVMMGGPVVAILAATGMAAGAPFPARRAPVAADAAFSGAVHVSVHLRDDADEGCLTSRSSRQGHLAQQLCWLESRRMAFFTALS